MTNQRTGVLVTGSSASDDSQSQPPKTPPHAAHALGAAPMSTVTTATASDVTMTTAEQKSVLESGSMGTVFGETVSVEKTPSGPEASVKEAKGPQSLEGASTVRPLDFIDSAIERAVLSGEHPEKISCEISREPVRSSDVENVAVDAVTLTRDLIESVVDAAMEKSEARTTQISHRISPEISEQISRESMEDFLQKTEPNSETSEVVKDSRQAKSETVERLGELELGATNTEAAKEVAESADRYKEEVKPEPEETQTEVKMETAEAAEEPAKEPEQESRAETKPELGEDGLGLETEEEERQREESVSLANALMEELKVLSGVSVQPEVKQEPPEVNSEKLEVKEEKQDSEKTGKEEIKTEMQDGAETERSENTMGESEPTRETVEKTDTNLLREPGEICKNEQGLVAEVKVKEEKMDAQDAVEGTGPDARGEKDQTPEDTAAGTQTQPVNTDAETASVMVKAEDKEDKNMAKETGTEKEAKEPEKNGEEPAARDDPMQEALKLLTSELMFLNESATHGDTGSDVGLTGSHVDMEWEEPEVAAPDTDKAKGEAKWMEADEKDVKAENEGKEGQQTGVENLPDPDDEDSVIEMKQETRALTSIGADYASSVTSESETEERSVVTSSKIVKESPLAKIAEAEENKEKENKEAKQDLGVTENLEIDQASVSTEKKEAEEEEQEEEHESRIDAETGEFLLPGEKSKKLSQSAENLEAAPETKEEERTGETKGEQKSAAAAESKPAAPEGEKKDVEDAVKEVGKGSEAEASEKELVELCMKGLALCLRRFPQHFKALYRLAHVYYQSRDHKVRHAHTAHTCQWAVSANSP